MRHAAELALTAFGYRFHTNKPGTSIIFEAVTEGLTSWRSQFVVYEESKVIELNVFVSDDLYHPSRERWVLELACRANDVFPTGAFVFRWGSGDVRFRVSAHFADRDPSAKDIERVMNSVSFPVKVWEEAFRHRHSSKVTPEAALSAALIKHDAYERDDVSNATRRALFKFSKTSSPRLNGELATSEKPTLTLL